MTEPEKRLWRHLRQRLPVERTHFRRQVPIEGYVADFCCLKARLVIEVDGNQHGFDANAQRDAARTEALKSRGYRMLRFSNREVMTAIDIVLDTILAALGPSPPTPGPSPQGGGGVARRRKQGRMMATGSHLPPPCGEGRLGRRPSGVGGVGPERDLGEEARRISRRVSEPTAGAPAIRPPPLPLPARGRGVCAPSGSRP